MKETKLQLYQQNGSTDTYHGPTYLQKEEPSTPFVTPRGDSHDRSGPNSPGNLQRNPQQGVAQPLSKSALKIGHSCRI